MASSHKLKTDTPVKNTLTKNINKPITLETIWSGLSDINDNSGFNNINIKLLNLDTSFKDFNNSLGLFF